MNMACFAIRQSVTFSLIILCVGIFKTIDTSHYGACYVGELEQTSEKITLLNKIATTYYQL